MTSLILGSSSWSEKSWSGSFYPQALAPKDWLGYYATRFPAVEADVTYYRVPDRSLVNGWKRKTPPEFRITAKFPRGIVHAGTGPQPNAEVLLRLDVDEVRETRDRFLESMSHLRERAGPLVLQFPYFNQRAFAGRGPFLDRLAAFLEALPKDFRYVVEIRNKNWVDAEFLSLLREHRVAFCLLDLVYMPHPDGLIDKLDLVTAGDFVYARLIGNRKAIDAKTKTFDRIVIDQSARLERWAALFAKLAPGVREVLGFVNNHYAGHSPETLRELMERCTEHGLEPAGPPPARPEAPPVSPPEPGDVPF